MIVCAPSLYLWLAVCRRYERMRSENPSYERERNRAHRCERRRESVQRSKLHGKYIGVGNTGGWRTASRCGRSEGLRPDWDIYVCCVLCVLCVRTHRAQKRIVADVTPLFPKKILKKHKYLSRILERMVMHAVLLNLEKEDVIILK